MLRKFVSFGIAVSSYLFLLSTAGAQELTGEVEVLYWNLERFDDTPISVNGTTDTVLIDSSDLDPGFQPGTRATLGWSPEPWERWEVSGFWVGTHSMSETVTDPAPNPPEEIQTVTTITFPGGQGFAGDFQHTVELESNIWGIEANYVRELNEISGFRPSVLAGLRYVRFNEKLQLDVIDNDPARLIGLVPSDMDVDVTNDMIGVQFGLMGDTNLTDRLTLSVGGKAGMYANYSEQKTNFNDGEVPFSTSFSESDWGVSGIVQGGFNLGYALTDNMEVSVGYELTFLGGAALAPDNFANAFMNAQFNDPLTLDQGGSILYHGASARFRMTF